MSSIKKSLISFFIYAYINHVFSVLRVLQSKMFYGLTFLIFPMHATRSANFNILGFITYILFYEEYTL